MSFDVGSAGELRERMRVQESYVRLFLFFFIQSFDVGSSRDLIARVRVSRVLH